MRKAVIRFGWSDSSVTMFTPAVREITSRTSLISVSLNRRVTGLAEKSCCAAFSASVSIVDGGASAATMAASSFLRALASAFSESSRRTAWTSIRAATPLLLRHPFARPLQAVPDFGRAADPLQPHQGQLVLPVVGQGAAVGGGGVFQAVDPLELVALADKFLGGHPECSGKTDAGLQIPRIVLGRLLVELDRLVPASLLGQFLAGQRGQLQGAAGQETSQEERKRQPSDLTEMLSRHACASPR